LNIRVLPLCRAVAQAALGAAPYSCSDARPALANNGAKTWRESRYILRLTPIGAGREHLARIVVNQREAP
jgi:hypothetical protein